MHRGIVLDYMDLLASRLSSAAYVADPDDEIDWAAMDQQLLRVPDVVDESAEDPVEGFGALSDDDALAAALDWWTELSVDATSPLHDAVNGRGLYDQHDNGRISRVDRVAGEVIEGVEDTHSGFFTERARTLYGHDADAARAWWNLAEQEEIGMENLLPEQPLAQALGWLASGPGSSTTAVTRHWIGHNHWVCDILAQMTPSRQRSDWGVSRIQGLLHGQSNTVTRAAETWLQVIDMHDGAL